jgi:hypothetical protein
VAQGVRIQLDITIAFGAHQRDETPRAAVHRASAIDYAAVRIATDRFVTGTGLAGVHRREPLDLCVGIGTLDRVDRQSQQ